MRSVLRLHTMKPTFICLHCGQEFERNPRIKKGQEYCRANDCQQARKRAWKRKKYATSRDYREKCRKWQNNWWEKLPAHQYMSQYRARNPDYVRRNRDLQRKRNQQYRQTQRLDFTKKIVNGNSFRSYRSSGGICAFIPGKWQKIVNGNSLTVTIKLQQ